MVGARHPSAVRSRPNPTSDPAVAPWAPAPRSRATRSSVAPRPPVTPLREEQTPTTTRKAFHRRVSPTLMCELVPISIAVTCVSARIRPSPAALRANLPTACAVVPIRPLGPRPREARPIARHDRDSPLGSLSQAGAQRLLQLQQSDARSRPSSDRFSRCPPPAARVRGSAGPAFACAYAPLLRGWRPPASPCRRKPGRWPRTNAASCDDPSEARPPAPQGARTGDSSKLVRQAPRCLRQRLTPTAACGGGRRRTKLGRAGR